MAAGTHRHHLVVVGASAGGNDRSPARDRTPLPLRHGGDAAAVEALAHESPPRDAGFDDATPEAS